MKWEKQGLIFNPTEHTIFGDCKEFAQSPQAIVLKDRVRIFFSTREKTGQKFISQIAFVDFDKKMQSIIGISEKPVIAQGELGCFDEHGIFPISPFVHDNKLYAYTCGWSRRKSVSVDTSIGLAISTDNGLSFQRLGNGPILSSSLNEPMLVGDGFVKHFEGPFHMWYIFGKHWLAPTESEPPARVYKIAHATSDNGIEWKKEDGKCIISDKLGLEECQALPTVIKISDTYHMYFCYRQATDFRTNPTRGYRLGYAYSSDLKSWVRTDDKSGLESSTEDWDSDMECYPNLFQVDQQVYLLYNGNQFGKFGFGLAKLMSVN